ncbi:cobyrinate a,c-diamide synthase [Actinocrispum wychmicini]|uniref:Hydrogenobyrinate a,c-diamide synthase n=1 Tax=Actinocrispum wychmicini TaxID=1213861 RepID=A0A4R2IN91_9PSEU|nr:cobyrinate a,c-diamide synthase [Actinocrispum wychmicini]TCO46524.1 cobyrinic acid a,c-diamide synthase [Actinocrispum wychmicini]
MVIPRVVIAAPASGTGKTTVATGLMAALRRRGTKVAPFKVGPDYIDPGYHTLAAGRPGRNLDPVLVGESLVAPLFAHGALGTDIAVIEGVMGMFDGRHPTADFGSTAHLAKLLRAPVLLVVDAWGQARSMAALVHGFRAFDPDVTLAGVIANRVGSTYHAEILAGACAEVGLPLLGALRREDAMAVPSRHLGLVTAAEHGPEAVRVIDIMARLVAGGVDLDAVVKVAATAAPLDTEPWRPEVAAGEGRPTIEVGGSSTAVALEGGRSGTAVAVDRGGSRPVVAVAGGAAFTFGYAEHVEILRAAGADVAVFDPLRDPELPAGTRGVVLPGGFPEQHAEALSANSSLRQALKAFDGPVHAECGGLLFLVKSLDGHPMCGVLDATAEMTPSLSLGYRDAVAPGTSVLCAEGTRWTGHEFHRTVVRPPRADQAAWVWRDREGVVVREGFVCGRIHASYLHTHPAGNPGAIARFVRACT